MNNTVKRAFQMRKKFETPNFNIQNWFPGHMYTAMQKMKRKQADIDVLIEVHDARIPMSGRNPNLEYKFSQVPRILLFNKCDLIEPKMGKLILNSVMDQTKEKHVLFTNCTNPKDPGMLQVIPKILELLKESPIKSENQRTLLMVTGVPNVGKSSLINILRNTYIKKKKAAKVGALAGVTRSVMEKIKIHEDPPLYLYDTPGITVPTMKNKEVILKLGLCGTLEDKLLPKDVATDYLLYFLNKHRNFSYTYVLGLPEPCDDIREVLLRTAIHHQFTMKIRNYDKKMQLRPDFNRAAEYFLRCFRNGELGPICLDQDILY